MMPPDAAELNLLRLLLIASAQENWRLELENRRLKAWIETQQQIADTSAGAYLEAVKDMRDVVTTYFDRVVEIWETQP